MISQRNNHPGFIKLILMFIVFAAVLFYFEIDVRGYIDNNEELKEKVVFVGFVAETAWSDYLSRPIFWVWDNLFIKYIWNNITVPSLHPKASSTAQQAKNKESKEFQPVQEQDTGTTTKKASEINLATSSTSTPSSSAVN